MADPNHYENYGLKCHHDSHPVECPMCHHPFSPRTPIELFDLTLGRPVCFHCGFREAGPLAQLAADYYESFSHLHNEDDQVIY